VDTRGGLLKNNASPDLIVKVIDHRTRVPAGKSRHWFSF